MSLFQTPSQPLLWHPQATLLALLALGSTRPHLNLHFYLSKKCQQSPLVPSPQKKKGTALPHHICNCPYCTYKEAPCSLSPPLFPSMPQWRQGSLPFLQFEDFFFNDKDGKLHLFWNATSSKLQMTSIETTSSKLLTFCIKHITRIAKSSLEQRDESHSWKVLLFYKSSCRPMPSFVVATMLPLLLGQCFLLQCLLLPSLVLEIPDLLVDSARDTKKLTTADSPNPSQAWDSQIKQKTQFFSADSDVLDFSSIFLHNGFWFPHLPAKISWLLWFLPSSCWY